ATHFEYDALNRIKKITYPLIFNEHGHKTTPIKRFSYEKLGTIKTITDENGYKTTITYNAAGKVFAEELPDGTKHICSYDKRGNLVKEIAPNGTEQKMSYDAFGRMTSLETLLSKKTWRYNSFRLIEEVSPTKETHRYTYDSAGRIKECFL